MLPQVFEQSQLQVKMHAIRLVNLCLLYYSIGLSSSASEHCVLLHVARDPKDQNGKFEVWLQFSRACRPALSYQNTIIPSKQIQPEDSRYALARERGGGCRCM